MAQNRNLTLVEKVHCYLLFIINVRNDKVEIGVVHLGEGILLFF